MKILQIHSGLNWQSLFFTKARAGAAFGALLSLAALTGCTGAGEPNGLFVESAQADPLPRHLAQAQDVVNSTQENENFSSNDPSNVSATAFASMQDFSAMQASLGGALVRDGQPVSAIDTEMLPKNSSWQYAHYVNYPITVEGYQDLGHKVIIGAGFITHDDERKGFDSCGAIPMTDNLVDELRYPPSAPEACALSEVEPHYYQNDRSLSVEYYCGEQLIAARHYQKIAEQKTSLYHLEFSLLSPPRDYSDTDACIETTYYWNNQQSNQLNTVVDIYGNILSDSYHLQMQLNHIEPNQSFFTFDNTSGEQQHDFVFNFAPFGRYSSTQQESGFILWERSLSPQDMRAEFEVLIDDVVEGERHVEGVITPSSESLYL